MAVVRSAAPDGATLLACRPGEEIEPAAEFRNELRGAHVMKGQTSTDEPRGVHVNRSDPFCSVEHRALHAVRDESFDLQPLVHVAADATLFDQDAQDAVLGDGVAAAVPVSRSRKRRGRSRTGKRRWGLAPVVGAAGGLVVAVGGGTAFAYMAGNSASNDTSTVTAVSVKAQGTTGSADLLPGRPGTAYVTLRNPNVFGVTFDQVTPGATVVSDNTALCSSAYVSIAQTLPYTFPTGVTVSPGGTSGIQSIPDLVELAPDAPSSCQGVTFTVTLTLSGQSS